MSLFALWKSAKPRMHNSDITIIVVRAAGYSGATWFNVVLGSSPDALALGPPVRILNLPQEQAGQACYIHRESCPLWPAFLRKRDHRRRFFRDLAEYTGKRLFIVNYPPKELLAREIETQGFRVLHVKLVRDGRASLYSRMRHNYPDGGGTALQNIIEWQIPKWDQVDRKIMKVDSSVRLVVRYEDMVLNPERELRRLSKFTGFTYHADCLQFWKHEHHLAGGNTGVIDTLCRLQGMEGYVHARSDVYGAFTKSLESNPQKRFLDTSWEVGLTRNDRIAFDCLLGERNYLHGYERDFFEEDEVRAFWETHKDLTAQYMRKTTRA